MVHDVQSFIWNQRNLEENICNFVINTVPTEDLTQLGERMCAGKVMIKLGAIISSKPAHARSMSETKILQNFSFTHWPRLVFASHQEGSGYS